MEKKQRKANPSLIFRVWQSIRDISDKNSAAYEKIARELLRTDKIKYAHTLSILNDMVHDGFLCVTKPTRKNEKPLYFIPDSETFDDMKNDGAHDFYCFECHLPGNNLINCTDCHRVFHKDCARCNLTTPPFSLKVPVPDFVQKAFLQIYGYSYLEIPLDVDFFEPDTNKIIPITTETPTNHIAKEATSTDNDLNPAEMINLCSSCRLRKNNFYDLLADRSINEINYLLSFAFKRVRSWVSSDTFSPQEPKSLVIPHPDLDLLKSLLFRRLMTTETIFTNIKDNKYKSITEFICDLLDVHHCIGVLRNNEIPEYEASKYLVIDTIREVLEIRLCPDCYRHSNEKGDVWFSKPCNVTHQLIYAKISGYSYWPAKVLRQSNDQYDIRFFGGKHERALVDSHNIKPIHTNLQVLNVKKTQSLMKAIKEMEKYQELSRVATGSERYNFLPPNSSTPYNVETIDGEKSNDTSKGIDEQQVLIKRPLRATRKTKKANETVKNDGIGSENIIQETPSTSRPMKDIIENQKPKLNRRKRNRSQESSADSDENTISDYIQGKGKKRRPNPKKESIIILTNSDTDDEEDEDNTEKPVLTALSAATDDEMKEEENEPVSSSTQNKKTMSPPDSPRIKGNIERSYYAVEQLSNKLQESKTIEEIREIALETLKTEIDKWQSSIREMVENHHKQINETKKREWCAVCKKEARYHCCWCVAYCTQECQEIHWNKGHKVTHKLRKDTE